MGRLSALILQAVCLAGCLTERQADASVIAARRRERSRFSRTVVSPPGRLQWCRLRGLSLSRTVILVKLITAIGGGKKPVSPRFGEDVDHLTNQRAREPVAFLCLSNMVGESRGTWERDHLELSIFRDAVMWWWGGYLPHHQ